MSLDDGWSTVVKEGKLLNKGFTNIIDTWHDGKLTNKPYSAMQVDRDNVVVSAIKRSEDNTGLIIRVYETDGKETKFTASGELLGTTLSDTITPWAVNTYYLKDGATAFEKVLFTEYAE
jgi:alpha-mannosidase